MIQKSTSVKTLYQSSTRNRRGFTLVEVVTSIAILSMMLVALLMIQSRHMRQIKQASQIIVATELTDRLLGKWFAENEPLFDSAVLGNRRSGTFANNHDYAWRLYVKPVSTERLGARVLVLETFNVNDETNKPVVTIELLGSLTPDRAKQ